MGAFKAQEFVNTVWAFAKAGHREQQLFEALAAAAKQKIGNFNPRDIANTAWGLAAVKVECKDEQIFTALAAAAL